MKIECLRQVCRTKCTNKWTNGQRLALTELLSEPKNIWSIEIYMMMRTSLLNWLCEFEAHSTSGIIIFHWTAQHISLCNGKFILFWSCLSIFPTKSSNLLICNICQVPGVSRHKAAQFITLPQSSVNFYFDMSWDVAGSGAAPPLKTAKPKSCVN